MINCDKHFLMSIVFLNLSLSRHKSGLERPWRKRFKSAIEFRYQVKASAIQLRKTFAEFMIQIGLFKKFIKLNIFTSVEVCNMTRCSSRSDKLTNINSI